MESEYRKGYVYIQSHFAGIIAETEEGYTFAYDKDYLNKEAVHEKNRICHDRHK